VPSTDFLKILLLFQSVEDTERSDPDTKELNFEMSLTLQTVLLKYIFSSLRVLKGDEKSRIYQTCNSIPSSERKEEEGM
jgi:hypothetical protein